MKNAFWLISRLNWAKETVHEFADTPIEISQTEKQRDKRMKNTRTEYLSTANYKSCNIQVIGIPKGEETERRRNI